ncbi:MAG: ATP-binding protein [Nanoarchaeota archaeon]|nr:ATP-binding protein [Nanoarchaeota archaeon]
MEPIIEILKEWNAWWETGKVNSELEGKKRPLYQELLNSHKIKEISIITGVRRSGKSTLMYQIINELIKKSIHPYQILFMNLEDEKLSEFSLEEIYDVYKQELNPDKRSYIFIDEVHKKKGWEKWIRKKYDLKTNDKFFISGSCSYLIKKEYATLLTGRNLTFEVFPLSFKEYLNFNKIQFKNLNLITKETQNKLKNKLKEYISLGGFPEVSLKDKAYKKRILEQYFSDILYKDIIARYNLNVQKSKDLTIFLITNFTRPISLRNIRNTLGLSYDTSKDYISYLQESFLLFSLDHFSYSLKEQKTEASKIYCIDNGLRNSVSFKFSKDEGKLVENTVFINLRRNKKDIYYWKGQKEVDFIVKEKDNSLTAINVCYNNELNKREEESLKEFQTKFQKTKKLMIITKDIEEERDNIKFIPLWKWLLK